MFSLLQSHIFLLVRVTVSTLCHNKPVFYDPSDLPYSAYRVLTGLLTLSAVLGWIGVGMPDTLNFLQKPTLTDYAGLWQIYLALDRMHVVLADIHPNEDISDAFLSRAFILIAVCGFVGNFLASVLMKTPVSGLGASVGASTVYLSVVSERYTSRLLFGIPGVEQGLFWIYFLSILMKMRSLSFAVGAFFGFLVARYDLQQLDEISWLSRQLPYIFG